MNKDPRVLGALGMTTVAFAGSFVHTCETARDYGVTGWMVPVTALMPEGMVALSVFQLRQPGLSTGQRAWAWLTLTVAGGMTVWGNLAQAGSGIGPIVWTGFPALAAILLSGFVKIGHGKPQKPARTSVAPSVKPTPKAEPTEPQNALSVVREPVSDYESVILAFRQQHGRHPKDDEFKTLGVSRSRWFAHYKDLKEKGLVA